MKKITLLIALMIVSLGIAQPTTSATTPTKLSVDVKSVFSDAYTNISTVELFPNWNQPTLYANYVVPSSSPANNVIKYTNLSYQGINITAAGNKPGVDFSAMTTLHIDVWTPDVTSFKLFPIDDKTDLLFKTLTPSKSGWNSYDIVLATDFPTLNKASIRQFKFVSVTPASGATIYFDNIYFWRAPVATGTPTISFVIPSKLSSDAPFSLSSLVSSDSPGAFTFTSSNTSVATISDSTLTIKGAGTAIITANQAASGSFIAGSKTANLVVEAGPTGAAPTPPVRNAVDVKSIFSDAYTPIGSLVYSGDVDTYDTTWCGGTTEKVIIAGNATNKITGLGCEGVAFQTARFNATTMTNLHMDIWTPTATLDKSFNIKFSNWNGGSGEANAIQFSTTNVSSPSLPNPNPGTWISLDIPLTSMPGLRNDLVQFVITSDLGIVYYDNLYLWKAPAAVGTPTISFAIPEKASGDASFSLVSPIITSNSAGAFTFSSSNTSVATISGSTVTIVGVGSTTITANQAANGSYNASTATATLIVNPAAAPVPQTNAATVVGLYGGTYQVDGYSYDFGPVSSVDLDPTSGVNNALKVDFSVGGYGQGFGTKDISTMQYVHFDYYTTDATTFALHLISDAPFEAIYNIPGIVKNQWVSVNIPMATYKSIAGFNAAKFIQFKFGTLEAIPGTVYFDNLYFSLTDPSLGTSKFETSKVSLYPNPVKNTLNIEAKGSIERVAVYSILGQEVMSKSPKSNATTLQTSGLQKGTYIVKSTIDGKTATSKFIKE